MSDELLDDLRSAIHAERAVVLVGAGASIQASGNPVVDGCTVASWDGLLRHGLQRCRDLGHMSEPVARAMGLLLDAGELIDVAERVTKELGGPASGEFSRWLDETIGALRLEDPRVPEALGALRVPLLTTNYDTLLETATGRPALTWKEGSRWQLVAREPTRGVVHLHGSYDRPETVVLGARSYDAVLRDPKAQNALRTLASSKSMIFVGFGAGIADPNFSSLRQFLASVLGDSHVRHFRLVVDGEVERAREDHGLGGQIHVLGHGPDHGSLAGFLEHLAPPRRSGQVSVVTPPPRRRVLEVEISSTQVTASVPGRSPVQEPFLLDGKLQVETVALLDEWLRFQAGHADAERSSQSHVATVLGSILFDAVFTGKVRELYREQVKDATLSRPLSLVLKVHPDHLTRFGDVDTVALTSIPWELLCDHGGKGCLSTSASLTFSRLYYGETDHAEWQTPEALRVLVVVAQPEALVEPLRQEWDCAHDKKYDAIVDQIVTTVRGVDQSSVDEPPGMLGVTEPATSDRLQEALAEVHPQVLHYIGHGRARGNTGEIAFALEDSEAADWRTFTDFAQSFDSDLAPTLVFLHLCQGARSLRPDLVGDLARGNFNPLAFELIKRQVKMVVAMQYPASADTGLTFTKKFYDSIRTATVAQAVQVARKSVGSQLPVGGLVFYLRGEDGPIVPLDARQPGGSQGAPPGAGSTPPPQRRGRGRTGGRSERPRRPTPERAVLQPDAPSRSSSMTQRAGAEDADGGITL